MSLRTPALSTKRPNPSTRLQLTTREQGYSTSWKHTKVWGDGRLEQTLMCSFWFSPKQTPWGDFSRQHQWGHKVGGGGSGKTEAWDRPEPWWVRGQRRGGNGPHNSQCHAVLRALTKWAEIWARLHVEETGIYFSVCLPSYSTGIGVWHPEDEP